jgi:LmbE family N-acetylglucosaminyl deacetylase
VERDTESLKRSAVVFAPHPDDETLGCGGTVLKKIAAGSAVRLVVMTDGRRSHRALMDEDRLTTIRAAEAVEAASRLGIARERVELFGFRDSELVEHREAALERVGHVLDEDPPEEIYVPYRHDSTRDHVETRRVALEAAKRCRGGVLVYEYPVWFWHHWPWVPLELFNRRDLPGLVMAQASAATSLIRDFNSSVFVGDVMQNKRHALDAYASQMTRLVDDPKWMRLADVAEGEFLRCFFQPHEVFWEHRLSGDTG